ncbi:MAG: threonine--tRNA ligase [Candidatus Ratteibacteria bacterium]|jgi:threonyl-tRNA synthetase
MNSQETLHALWHSTSHILAHAVKRLYPETKLGTGPAIEEGFYYDFFRNTPFTPADLEKIAEEMKKICKENLPFQRIEVSKEEAKQMLSEEPFKQEILSEIENALVSFYRQGDFSDLCSGPHIATTGEAKHFKLLSLSSSYWRADESRESMQRIYGISFFEKSDLDSFLMLREEAKGRDHRTLGTKLDLFSLHPEFGAGLVYWHPKGAMVRKIIEDFWRDLHLSHGYQLLYTPHIAALGLWDTSGHTDFYRQNMYPPIVFENHIEYQLKPMNCPFHILVYKNRLRSYRELPLRWAELGTVYRFEKDGVLHGLLRVRGFTQDDAHIFCRIGQIEEEVISILDFVLFYLSAFGFSEYELFLSTRPAKYVGSLEHWKKATSALERALQKKGLPYSVDSGEGVFYGPKIDLKIKDSLKRTWQCSTIQVDFNIPERFEMSFVNEQNTFEQPIMIHRAVMGSLERFFGILIEHYGGAFPLWLAPVQIKVLSISDRFLSYAQQVVAHFSASGLRTELDTTSESLNKRIKNAESEKIPFIVVVGGKEEEAKTVAVRKHGKGMMGVFPLEEFCSKLRIASVSKKDFNPKEE